MLRSLRCPLVVMLAILSTGCGDKPSSAEVERLVTHDWRFTTPKSARIPRRIALAMRYGTSHPALHLSQQDWVSVDWVTHALYVNRFVRLADNAYASGERNIFRQRDTSSYGASLDDDAYEHMIDVRLTPEAEQSGDFTEDDDVPEPGMGYLPASRTPGWKLAVARRKFERVVEVLDKSATTETVLAGNAVAYFEFRWVPTAAGALFDQGGDAIGHLDQTSWSNAKQFFKLDSRVPQRAKVYLNRVEKGRWIVKGMECGKCGWFDAHP